MLAIMKLHTLEMMACPTEMPTVPPMVRINTNAAVLVAMSFNGMAACRAIKGVCRNGRGQSHSIENKGPDID